MRPTRLSTVMVAATVALFSRSAPLRAQDTAVGVNVGFASAVGFGGVTLTRSLFERARLEIGGGLGYSGWQLSVMPKLVLGEGRARFVAGAGVAVAWPADSRVASGHPVWLNVDLLGMEYRFDSGFAIFNSAGVTVGLGGGEICVPPDGCEPQFLRNVNDYWSPQVRAGVAYWF